MRTLIYNAWVVTMDEEFHEYKDGMLIIEDDVILYVGKTLNLPEEYDEELDAQGGIVIPGMINTHVHASMIPFRSLGDDCKDRLRRYLFPLEKQCMNESLAFLSAKYAITEMLLGGITTIVDMYYFMDKVADACVELGMRALLGETIIDMPTCDSEEPYGGLQLAENFLKQYERHELIQGIIAPHATNTNDADAFQKAFALAEKYDTMVTTHVAEMDYEMEYFEKTYQMTPIEWLQSIGCLTDRLLAVHCIHVSDHDINLMRKHKTSVALCIGSNTKAGKGVAPAKEMLAQNLNVGLGSDGASSGNTLDLFIQMRIFAGSQKTKYHDRGLFPAREVLALATIGGAKAIHKDHEIGSLEIGKKADITIIEISSINMFPIHDVYSALVYSANASNVQHVFVNGKHIVKDKQAPISIRELQEELAMEMKDFQTYALKRQHALLNEQ